MATKSTHNNQNNNDGSTKPGCLGFFLTLFQPDTHETTTDTKPDLKSGPLPYHRKKYLFSLGERPFFAALLHAVDHTQYHIFAKVRLCDIIGVNKGTGRYQSFFNRIQSNHIDFLICDKVNIRPLLAIELDDSSHQRKSRQQRDEFVDAALKAAGLPLLRIPAAHAYDPTKIAQQINAHIIRDA